MLDNITKKRIDDCRDVLVGKVPDPKSQIEQITIALIYKFMSDMDKSATELGGVNTFFSGEYSKYSWSNLLDPANSGNEMLNIYSEALDKLQLNPNLPELFRNIFKNAYLPYRDPNTLKMFLKFINDFEYSHSEKLGDAFEYLLSVMGSQGDAGQFRTPRHIIDFMVEILEPQKNETIADPACGTAGFLLSAYKYIIKTNTKDKSGDQLKPDERKKIVNNIVGYDISPDMVRLSLVNMYLHNFPTPKIFEYDTLSSEDRWDEKFDVIIANPPFMTPKGGITPHKKFGVQANKAEVLFTDYIAEHLNKDGRAGIIVPEGIVFQNANAYKSLRKMLVMDNYLVAVISLPSGVFQPYSGVKTTILILDKKLSKQTDKVLFIKVDNDGYSLGSQRKEIEKNDLPNALELFKSFKNSLINNTELELDKNSLLIEKSKIAEKDDYILNGDRYQINKVQSSKFEIVDINDYVTFKRGDSITRKDIIEGDIPVIAGGQKPAYYTNISNRDSNIITISSSGAYAGFIAIHNNPIFASDCFTLEANDCNMLNQFYLYYVLKSKQPEVYKLQEGMGQPHVYIKSFNSFQIPLPPIEVQEEIVAKIEGYEKIINGAKQVVENYKPQIKIDPSWELVELGSVCENLDNLRKPITASDRIKGDYPYYGASGIVDYVHDFIFEGNYLLVSEDGANLIARSTPIAFSINGKNWVNNHAHILKFKYLYSQYFVEYYLNSINLENYITGSAQPKLNQQYLNKIPIPYPPLEVQEAIVSQIENEQRLVNANKELIKIFEQKIKDEINKLWEE